MPYPNRSFDLRASRRGTFLTSQAVCKDQHTQRSLGFESLMLQIVFSEKKLDVRGPAIFLDRDGVINCRRPGDYVLSWSQFLFVSGIQAALKQLAALNLPMIVISNQAAVGKGLLNPVTLQEITVRMQQTLLADGVSLAAVFYCIHRADENCDCRKPRPAMLLRAANEFNIDLARSIFIGDSASDIQAGLAAGCKPILFGLTHFESFGNSVPASSIPVARTTEELFPISVKCLKNCDESA
jgi:D-glycero-D-manno-heptose 1,7-bisphosphate phosphatase